MRIIDADAFKEGWNDSTLGNTMRMVIDGQPTIDPESLPVVQQLRAEVERLEKSRETWQNRTRKLLADARKVSDELEKVKAERDAAVNDLHKTILDCGACNACKHQFKECAGVNLCDFDGEDHWEWRGVKEG